MRICLFCKHIIHSYASTDAYIYSLRVQRTQIWSMKGFYNRNRNYGVGYIPSIWVLGPLGTGNRNDGLDP